MVFGWSNRNIFVDRAQENPHYEEEQHPVLSCY